MPDSTESSATSTGTIILNQNALKPKNNQTHSVSQMSLQSTGMATSTVSLNKCHNTTSNAVVDKTKNKCSVIQCSYPTTTCNKEQQQPPSQPSTSTSSISISTITTNNGTISTIFILFSTLIYVHIWFFLMNQVS